MFGCTVCGENVDLTDEQRMTILRGGQVNLVCGCGVMDIIIEGQFNGKFMRLNFYNNDRSEGDK